ncbi:hypothetical protein [Lelliottia sp. RWM.1]|uniref:hypothetical protein n=1 Tax=Lelliottia sp. RWM.1 TaxID=2663242 RepID=UPI00193CA459|nr:hypothetical protein [Lelliottia sp. RWM.1]MBM3074261.1 hypothetical protein [Lelliottia sp. RWM.1]
MQWFTTIIVAILCLPVIAILLKNHINKDKTKLSDVILAALALPFTAVLFLFLSLAGTGTTSFAILWGILN